jgi:prolyl oligopeptidase
MLRPLIVIYAVFAAVFTFAQSPPPTPREQVIDTVHGVKIVDPYRWLEDQNSKQTRAWIASQDKYSDAFLKPLPQRAYLKREFARLARVDRTSVPIERNGRLFFSLKRASDEQAVLYYRDGLTGTDRVIVDPQPLSKSHTTSADFDDVSLDGRYVAYHLRNGGEDESTIFIRDLKTGKNLPDSLPRGNYWSFSLKPDMTGYYYGPHVNLVGVRIYYHEMGTPRTDDQEVFGKGYGPEIGLGASVTEDGHYLMVNVNRGAAQSEIYAQDLTTNGKIFPVVTGMDALYIPGYADGMFYLLTDRGAANRHIFRVDPQNTDRGQWVEVVRASKDSIESFDLVGGKLFVQLLHNVASRIKVYSPSGDPLGDLKLPGLGSATIPSGTWASKSAFYSYESFTTPLRIYHLDVPRMEASVWSQVRIPGIDPDQFTARQVWATSKDGTQVPMFMVFKKGLKFDGKRPTLITGYGGFDVNSVPYFSGLASVLAKNNAVYVMVDLRGGGEFGESWHEAGMRGKKQNVFDDLYAATRWLIANHVTNPSKDAVLGGSNGGLLVGAAVTQQPHLYKAAICEFPLLDMIRFHLFLQGPQWVPEYGSAADPQQFKWLYAYSPYQHVAKGTKFPATLFVTGDGDTRVAPLHARKMAAEMQWANAGKNPILLHYETNAGHSGGESVTQAIDTNSLVFSFLFYEIGVRVPAG